LGFLIKIFDGGEIVYGHHVREDDSRDRVPRAGCGMPDLMNAERTEVKPC
jgi:hypothetical protein